MFEVQAIHTGSYVGGAMGLIMGCLWIYFARSRK